MIVFDLECLGAGHRFEGWFRSSGDFEEQRATGMLCCPSCGSHDVAKAVQAANLGRKSNQAPVRAETQKPRPMHNQPMAPEAAQMLQALARIQAETIKQSRWVGESFVEDARAMHYGERDHELIHGQATLEEARDMLEEGIGVAPLLIPVAPPGETN